MGKETKKGSIETEETEVQVWTVTAAGRVEEAKEGPAVRIRLIERIDAEEREVMDYKAHAEQMVDVTNWTAISTDEPKWREQRSFAFDEALGHVKTFLGKEFRAAAKKKGNAEWTGKLSTLRNVVKDEGGAELARTKGKKIITFEPMAGADHAVALSVLSEHFPVLDDNCNVAFRLRDTSDFKEWSKGKNKDGEALVIMGQAEKVSPEKRQMLKRVYGFTPDFQITVCKVSWTKLHETQRKSLIYHELMHCGYDPVKKSTFMVRHTIEEFAEPLLVYGFKDYCAADRAMFAHDMVQAARNHGELKMIALGQDEMFDDGALRRLDDGVKAVAAEHGRRLRDTVAGMKDIKSVTISSGGQSATFPGGAGE